MFDKLLLLTVFVLVLAFIWAKGGDKFNRNIMQAPEGHMSSFDFFRIFLCLSLVLTHCTTIPAGLKASKSFHKAGLGTEVGPWAAPDWLKFAANDAFQPLVMSGIFAVDCFFVMSGFFTTLGLLRQLSKGQSPDILSCVASRFMRLAPVTWLPLLYGILRHDDAFFRGNDGNGGMYWHKIAGWLLFYGNIAGSTPKWSWDFCMTPLWSIIADFQSSSCLIVLVPMLHKTCGLRWMPCMFALLTVVFVIVRAAILFQDFECLNGERQAGILTNIGAVSTAHTQNFKEQMKREFGFTAFDMPMPPNSGCDKTVSDATDAILTQMYYPFWARITPFFCGAAMGCNYMWVNENRSIWSVESEMVKTIKFCIGRVALVASTLALLYATFFAYLRNPEHISTDAQGYWWIVCDAWVGTAASCILYSTIVPEDHPWHLSWLKWVTSLKCFYVCGGLSTWIYAFHWPVMWEFCRAVLFECAISNAILYFVIVTSITIPVAVLAYKFFEPACEHIRKLVMSGELSIAKALRGEQKLKK